MIMDQDLALLNAVAHVFPLCNRQLCTWHVEKNVLTQASSYFLDNAKGQEEFIKSWTEVI